MWNIIFKKMMMIESNLYILSQFVIFTSMENYDDILELNFHLQLFKFLWAAAQTGFKLTPNDLQIMLHGFI